MKLRPYRFTSPRKTASLLAWTCLCLLMATVSPGKACAAHGAAQSLAVREEAPQASLSAGRLDGYIARVAGAWEQYTIADGRVLDPLSATDTGDNYGVIMLADVMLKVAERTGDETLEDTGERILQSALTLPVPNDPFNLLAIASAIHDGRLGEFPPHAWEALATPLAQRAGQIGFPTDACLTNPHCYDNWRLVWSAGASLLLADDVPGGPDTLAGERSFTTAQIGIDLQMALAHAGAPLQAAIAGTASPKRGAPDHGEERLTSSAVGGGLARELSDPGTEPSAYELFSSIMLELIGESYPQAFTPALTRLRAETDRYALAMMAPDGQLSLSGRSLDQSWVQAAGAALGARRAVLLPASAGTWSGYANRALSYLLEAYPITDEGLLPIVPGLGLEWNRSIVDGYAALNQYEGLTLWLLSDALSNWPSLPAHSTVLPGDSPNLLADDLDSSGLVWGRSAGVWWELSGRATGEDPRLAQGLVAVKVHSPRGWRDLLALRPRRHGRSSAWTLGLPHGQTATPTFTRVGGNGAHAVLRGSYLQASNRLFAHASATLRTTATGVVLHINMPPKTTLHTTIWLTGGAAQRVIAPGASITHGTCEVTASGLACPVTIHWRKRHVAVLEVLF